VLLAGEGPEEPALRSLANSLGLQDSVRFLGHRDDVHDLLTACDVVVLPSISSEDFPVTIVEAMAARRPVVASRVAGTPEQVVPGVTGWLVPPGDEVALAAALREAVADPGRRAAMGEAARSRYEERYSPAIVTAMYQRLYAFVLTSASPSGSI
jgi:glycosyltransferase involved in cell wall biosynthesis